MADKSPLTAKVQAPQVSLWVETLNDPQATTLQRLIAADCILRYAWRRASDDVPRFHSGVPAPIAWWDVLPFDYWGGNLAQLLAGDALKAAQELHGRLGPTKPALDGAWAFGDDNFEGQSDPAPSGQDRVSGGAQSTGSGADAATQHNPDARPVDPVQQHVDAICTDLRSGVVKPKQREAVRDALQDAAVGSIIGGRR